MAVSLRICLFLSLFSNKSHGQIIQDISGIAITSHTKATFKDQPSESLNPKNKFQLNTYDAWLPVPPIKIGKTTIFSNLNYRLMDFNYENNTDDPNRIEKFRKSNQQ